jgi:prepilin-type N-terminal cleavage/methylation domain-containing protein
MRQAFTLLEVMIVLVILVIIGAIAYPSLQAIQERFRLDSSVDEVKSRFAEARAHAIEEGRPYRFAVQPDSSKFRVAPDASEFWDGGSGSGSGDASETPPLIVEEEIEKEVLFKLGEGSGGGSDSGSWSTLVVFLPDGTCREDAEIRFELGGFKPMIIKVRAMTGIVTTNRGQNENAP